MEVSFLFVGCFPSDFYRQDLLQDFEETANIIDPKYSMDDDTEDRDDEGVQCRVERNKVGLDPREPD